MLYLLNLLCTVLVVFLIKHFHLTGFGGWMIGYLQAAFIFGFVPLLKEYQANKK